MFVTNLYLVVMNKDPCAFWEAGTVFNVFFFYRETNSGRGRGLGFVCFKTEWDMNGAL